MAKVNLEDFASFSLTVKRLSDQSSMIGILRCIYTVCLTFLDWFVAALLPEDQNRTLKPVKLVAKKMLSRFGIQKCPHVVVAKKSTATAASDALIKILKKSL